jgi:hypothetical protein
VLNNPLKYTDPSGEKAEGGGILAFFAAAVISVFRAIFGSNDTGYSNANVSNTPVITDFSLGSNNSTEVAAMADVPPESGTGYRLEEPKGIWQSFKSGVVNGYSRFWSGIGKEFNEVVRNPWFKWKQNVIERGGWKNFIPLYAGYQATIGAQAHNFQTAYAGVSNLYNGNYYQAGQIYGYYQGEGHLQLGLMVATGGVVKGVGLARGLFLNKNINITYLTRNGNYPSWSTVKSRYWKIMNNGEVPTGRATVRIRSTNEIKTINVSKELHHVDGRVGLDPHRFSNLREVWPWEHEEIDPFRHTGYEFINWVK